MLAKNFVTQQLCSCNVAAIAEIQDEWDSKYRSLCTQLLGMSFSTVRASYQYLP